MALDVVLLSLLHIYMPTQTIITNAVFRASSTSVARNGSGMLQ